MQHYYSDYKLFERPKQQQQPVNKKKGFWETDDDDSIRRPKKTKYTTIERWGSDQKASDQTQMVGVKRKSGGWIMQLHKTYIHKDMTVIM